MMNFGPGSFFSLIGSGARGRSRPDAESTNTQPGGSDLPTTGLDPSEGFLAYVPEEEMGTRQANVQRALAPTGEDSLPAGPDLSPFDPSEDGGTLVLDDGLWIPRRRQAKPVGPTLQGATPNRPERSVRPASGGREVELAPMAQHRPDQGDERIPVRAGWAAGRPQPVEQPGRQQAGEQRVVSPRAPVVQSRGQREPEPTSVTAALVVPVEIPVPAADDRSSVLPRQAREDLTAPLGETNNRDGVTAPIVVPDPTVAASSEPIGQGAQSSPRTPVSVGRRVRPEPLPARPEGIQPARAEGIQPARPEGIQPVRAELEAPTPVEPTVAPLSQDVEPAVVQEPVGPQTTLQPMDRVRQPTVSEVRPDAAPPRAVRAPATGVETQRAVVAFERWQADPSVPASPAPARPDVQLPTVPGHPRPVSEVVVPVSEVPRVSTGDVERTERPVSWAPPAVSVGHLEEATDDRVASTVVERITVFRRGPSRAEPAADRPPLYERPLPTETVRALRDRPSRRPGAPLARPPEASPVRGTPDRDTVPVRIEPAPASPAKPATPAPTAPSTGSLELTRDLSVEIAEELEISFRSEEPLPTMETVRGALGGEPLTPSFRPLSKGGETAPIRGSWSRSRGEEGVLLETASAGGREEDLRKHPIPLHHRRSDVKEIRQPVEVSVETVRPVRVAPVARDAGSATTATLGSAPVVARHTGVDVHTSSGEGDGEDLERHDATGLLPEAPRAAAEGFRVEVDEVQEQAAPTEPENELAPENEDDRLEVVARLDRNTRVEVAVQKDKVEVVLEAPEADLQHYDGLEDELRSALAQGESDLAGYRTRSEADQEGRSDRSSERAEPTDGNDGSDGSGSRTVKRGSLLDILA